MTTPRSILLLAAFFLAMHAFVLPPHGFFSGDQGPKYLQTRAFAEHGPLDPGIDVLSRDIDPGYRHQDPILRNRGGRLVATFSWLLPLLSAPFFAIAGTRGIYVVPALAAIVIFLLAGSLGRRLGDPGGLFTAWCVVLATPALFYGLECWEHAPAAAAVLAVALLLMPDGEPAEDARSRWRFAAAGAFAVVGGLFREEAMLAWPAFLIARVAADASPARMREALRAAAWGVAGIVAVVALTIPGNRIVYGSLLPLHLTSEVEKTSAYWPMRAEILRAVFSPLPFPHRIFYTWPFIFGLAALPALPLAAPRGAVRFVAIGALLLGIGTLAIAPSPGGAQWGPRYLFVVAPLIAALAAAGARVRPTDRRSAAATWFVRATLVSALAAQAIGLVYLARAKARDARITARLEAVTRERDAIVTDVAWLPEVTATILDRRRILFARSPAEVTDIALDAVAHEFHDIVVVGSLAETTYAPPIELGSAGSCVLTRTHHDSIGERGLVAYRYACAVPGAVVK